MASDLHISIGVGPSEDNSILKNERRMTKSALLYGNTVKLCSPMADLLISEWEKAKVSLPNFAKFLIRYYSTSPHLEDQAQIRHLRRFLELHKKKRKPRQEILDYERLKSNISRNWETMKTVDDPTNFQTQEQNLTESQKEFRQAQRDLRKAKEVGILELHPFTQTSSNLDMAYEFFGLTYQTLLNRKTYPLFDSHSSSMLKIGLEKGIIEVPAAPQKRNKQVSLASDLLQRLPHFDEASIDEIIDIRKELEIPLVNFRAAIIRFSEAIESSSWDPDFPLDAEESFRKEVEPAISAIEQAVEGNTYLSALRTRVIDKPGFPVSVGGAFSFFLGNQADLLGIAALAFSLLGLSALDHDAMKQMKEKTQEIEGNQLFFYYKAGELLRSS